MTITIIPLSFDGFSNGILIKIRFSFYYIMHEYLLCIIPYSIYIHYFVQAFVYSPHMFTILYKNANIHFEGIKIVLIIVTILNTLYNMIKIFLMFTFEIFIVLILKFYKQISK